MGMLWQMFLKNYLDDSSSCCCRTEAAKRRGSGSKWLWEAGARAGLGVPERNLQTAGVHQVTDYDYQQIVRCKGFLSRLHSSSVLILKGAEPQRKMFAETETQVTSIPPCSEQMLDRLIFSPGCLSSSDLKISFNFFHLGGKSCKVSLQAQAGVKSKAPYHPKQSPPQGRAPQPALMGTSLHLHTCLLSLDHFDFCSKGKVPFPFCLGQDLGCEPCKLCL